VTHGMVVAPQPEIHMSHHLQCPGCAACALSASARDLCDTEEIKV